MNIIYANNSLELDPKDNWKMRLFLAGCTSRENKPTPWQQEALEILKEKESNFRGMVYIPEQENGQWLNNWEEQVEWETTALALSDVILFWIDRDMKDYFGLTSNFEAGYWFAKNPDKIVLGMPPNSQHVRYIQYWAKKLNIPHTSTLRETVNNALDLMNDKMFERKI